MKKNLFTLSLVALFGLGLASCNKCVTCNSCDEGVTFEDASGNEVTEIEICEKDAADKSEYDAAVSLYESFGGCTCK